MIKPLTYIDKNFFIFFNESYCSDPYIEMAKDEYLLNLVELNKIPGILRFYNFKKPSITLGYFQKTKKINKNKIEKDKIFITRRITGGNAIFHKNDLIYSIILNKNIFIDFNSRNFFLFISNIILDSLKKLNFYAEIKESIELDYNNYDCFNSISQYEIISKNNKKIVGSAQKITKNSILQQGSINLNYNKYLINKYFNFNTNKLNFIKTIFFNNINFKKISKIKINLKKEFSEIFNLNNYLFTIEDNSEINKLIKEKYNNKEWIYRL